MPDLTGRVFAKSESAVKMLSLMFLLESGTHAILKLNNSPNEGNLLSTLKGSSHLVCDAVYDVAGGISNAAKRDIANRDITLNNFGQLEGRGYLYDFSAAKGMAIGKDLDLPPPSLV
ncbi:hypothetical protein WJX77_008653 [Trebouxia sp. C0004]